MSANNLVLIKQFTEEPYYRVSERCAEETVIEDDCYDNVGVANTLEEAVNIAEEYQRDEIVEYGIHFQLLK